MFHLPKLSFLLKIISIVHHESIYRELLLRLMSLPEKISNQNGTGSCR